MAARQISKAQKLVLDLIENRKDQFRPIEVFNEIRDDITRAAFDAATSKLYDAGVLNRPSFGVLVVNHKELKAYCKGGIEVVDRPYNKLPRKPRFTLEAAPMPEPEAPAINLSHSADALADSLSSVLKENSDYRALLLKVHTTIGKALGIEPPKTEE